MRQKSCPTPTHIYIYMNVFIYLFRFMTMTMTTLLADPSQPKCACEIPGRKATGNFIEIAERLSEP